MRSSSALVFLATTACLASPIAAPAAGARFVISQSVQIRGSVQIPGVGAPSFTVASSSPLSFPFVSPYYNPTFAAVGGDSVQDSTFALAFTTPITFSFLESAFNPYGLSGPTAFSGSGAGSPYVFMLTIPDGLAAPVVVATVDGPQSYLPTVLLDSSAGAASVTVTPVSRRAVKYLANLTFADPNVVGQTDTAAVNGTLTLKAVNGVWGLQDVNSVKILRGDTVTLARSSGFSPGPIPEPQTYGLIIVGVAGAGAGLRRRRAATAG